MATGDDNDDGSTWAQGRASIERLTRARYAATTSSIIGDREGSTVPRKRLTVRSASVTRRCET